MKSVALLLSVYLLTCYLAYPEAVLTTANSARPNITGQYVLRYSNVRSSLNVLLLPNDKIKFSLTALLKTGGGETRNGVVEGTVALKNNIAIYRQGECRIYMKFLDNRVVVKESNVDDCGFGAFVTAQGTYIKKSRKPRFDS